MREGTPGLHVIVALTPHEARLLVAAIDEPRRDEGWTTAVLADVRTDIMEGLASLSRLDRALQEHEA